MGIQAAILGTARHLPDVQANHCESMAVMTEPKVSMQDRRLQGHFIAGYSDALRPDQGRRLLRTP